MTILLIGKDGQLGHELQAHLSEHQGDKAIKAVGRETLDLSEPDQISRLIHQLQPSIIVNAAAYTAVDKAETDIERANAINGTAPTVMAKAAQACGATLIHVSTDYVFDGTKNTPYLEDDPTHPLGAYGESKRLGERGVQDQCDRYLILRTAWVYGAGGKGNFVKTMLRLGKERDELRVVVDQVGTPTWTGHLADVIGQIIDKLNATVDKAPFPFGIYHVTNSGAISWYDFAIAIFEEAEHLGFPLQIKRVVPITTADYPTLAKRPAYSVLSHQKTMQLLDAPPPHWRKDLRQMLKAYAQSV
jgi:dTDP-4-dehydrorhamnose reductase